MRLVTVTANALVWILAKYRGYAMVCRNTSCMPRYPLVLSARMHHFPELDSNCDLMHVKSIPLLAPIVSRLE